MESGGWSNGYAEALRGREESGVNPLGGAPKSILMLDYVVRAEVDAGFVFATNAALAKDKVRVALTAEKHKPISYPIALVVTTHAKETAQRFINYVLSPEGREVLSRYGFGRH